MSIGRFLGGAVAAILMQVPSAAPAAADVLPVEWTMAPAAAPEKVRLEIRYEQGRNRSQYSRNVALAEFQGLSEAQLASDGAPVRYRLAREAGVLDCNGIVRQRRGTGECLFTGSAAFADTLARRGIGRPTTVQQFNLAMSGVGSPLLSELDRQGYTKPTVNQLVALGIHGATVDYLRGLDAAGYRVGTADKLTAMRIHGVTPEYIRELISIHPRYRGVSADQLVAMRIHGVSASKVRALAELGYANLAHDELMQMSIHGVTPDFVRGMREAGYRQLTARELVQMRIHGVSPKFIGEMAEAGYRNLTAQQLLRLKIHGVNADMARRANAALKDR